MTEDMIMKKQYTAPAIKVVTLLTPLLMAAISGEQSSVGTGNSSVGDNTPDLANRGRGDWDYIW